MALVSGFIKPGPRQLDFEQATQLDLAGPIRVRTWVRVRAGVQIRVRLSPRAQKLT